MLVTFLPILYLYCSAPHPLYPGIMCGVDVATMKQLLAEQRRDLISDMKEQIVSEVATQLAPHAARLDKLQKDQTLLNNQLRDICHKLKLSNVPTSRAQSNSQPSCPSPAPSGPASQGAPHHPSPALPKCFSTTHVSEIESAKCTLNFSPITRDDLNRVKRNESEDVPLAELLNRAVHEFLELKMKIPPSTISKMMINKIWASQDLEFQQISVEFSSICPVNTIFRFVKNLAPHQRVSIFIPPALQPHYEELKNIAYHLRNSEPRHKTVIKYYGYNLALYSKVPGDRNWRHVPTPLAASPHSIPRCLSPLKQGIVAKDNDNTKEQTSEENDAIKDSEALGNSKIQTKGQY